MKIILHLSKGEFPEIRDYDAQKILKKFQKENEEIIHIAYQDALTIGGEIGSIKFYINPQVQFRGGELKWRFIRDVREYFLSGVLPEI